MYNSRTNVIHVAGIAWNATSVPPPHSPPHPTLPYPTPSLLLGEKPRDRSLADSRLYVLSFLFSFFLLAGVLTCCERVSSPSVFPSLRLFVTPRVSRSISQDGTEIEKSKRRIFDRSNIVRRG